MCDEKSFFPFGGAGAGDDCMRVAYGTNPHDVFALIGPCCFEVPLPQAGAYTMRDE